MFLAKQIESIMSFIPEKYLRFLINLILSPRALFSMVKSVLRGLYYIIWFRISRPNTVIKFPFLCFTKVDISGPGKVFIDRRCSVYMNTFDHLVIKTLSPDAEVRIGKKCNLGGQTIRCRGKVSIGDNVLTAANLIQDVMITSHAAFHSMNENREDASEIRIGNNVWLCGQSLVLSGSSVGNGSVVGLNGLVHNAMIKDSCLVSGNPAIRPIPIDKILKLQRTPD